jgi:hypothetical protein
MKGTSQEYMSYSKGPSSQDRSIFVYGPNLADNTMIISCSSNAIWS